MHRLQQIPRWLKFKYMMLIRAKGGASIVAMGFAIGLAIEMFTLPTLGFAFVLIFPLCYLLKGNLPAALIGFVVGKIIYIPMMYPNSKVGGWILPKHLSFHIPVVPEWFNHLLLTNLKLIVGGMVDGAILGMLCYFPIKYSLDTYKAKRKDKKKLNRAKLEARI
ncbi:DUF2062 domain-containing protein [Cohnella cholangitidis]|uniref:DUF2062 domain-containing protein n=1 Tax=Cohnella cholangitidis TaxID=2598458 RepID=A0A7G5C2S4_9BACL|nr:DUF2062 domain-containing protein [Cohnella cholangitidis]QMV43508.1 DUF2062 domain-containing protein [Cohnella cholangitidis]